MSKYEKQEELKREELSQEEQLLKTEADNTKLTDDSKNVKMTDACEESRTENTARENKMGTMPMGKLLISVSLPMVISMLVQALYNVVDSVFVSHFDQDALTAVSTIFPLQNLMIGVTSGLGVGFNALISKSLGEKNQKKANDAAGQGIFLELIGFAIFLLIGLFGIIIYIVIFVLLYLFKKRRTISWNYMFEGIFCIYCVTLLNLTGIFTLSYSLNGPFNYNLLPFIGSSIVPILLNFALFFPLGFLLPLIFRSCRGNWKKVAIISGLISFLIELLQLFGGRYAEMEDFLINTLGGFSGYIVCTAICERKTNRRKAVVSIVTLCLTLALCLIGIYAVGDNEKQLPDGLSAVENSIAEINVYSEGEERSISIDSYQYRSFASQISNCGGHLLEIQKTSEGEIWNDTDCFIEIIYTADQTIKFENAENFSIECADRLLYNADKNVLYWGEAGYQNCLDYTKMNEEMQAHKEEILKGYEELSTSIRDCFNQ